jgi:hypothetical protein
MQLEISMTRNTFKARLVLLAVGVLFAAGSAGQQVPPTAPAAPAAKAAPPPKAASAAKATRKATQPPPQMGLEPRAVDILKASSARLAAARTLKFTATVAYESPSRVGLPLVYTTKSDVVLQRPDKLRIVTPGDGPASEFYYDGKVMMAFAPAENLVAVTDAPPTIDATLLYANDLAGIYFPFSDVMVADPYGDIAGQLKLAFYIGQSNVVGGITTDMVAFASDDVFVQVWIGAEDKLPRVMRAVYRKDPTRTRHLLELSNWQLDAPIAPDTFTAANAAKAVRIAFAHPAPLPPPPAAKSKPAKTQQPKAQ